MMLHMNERTRIEDPRNYGTDVVNDLRILLTAGGCAQRDPRRENFYELEHGDHTFYIYVSPVNGEVMLLAKWMSSTKAACLPTAQLSA